MDPNPMDPNLMDPNPDFIAALRDIYPGLPEDIANNMIQIAEENNPDDTFEAKLNIMVNLLSGYEGACNIPIVNEELLLDQHYEVLMQMFPDANPDFMLQFCQDQMPDFNLNVAVQRLITDGYQKIEVDPLSIWEQLKDALPNADPTYLKKEAERLALLTPDDVSNFLQCAIEENDYPTMKEYLQHKKEQEELAFYKQFDIDKFLEAIPNPVDWFNDPNRSVSLDEEADESDVQYARTFLYNNYSFIRKKYIDLLFDWKNRNLAEICDRLDRMSKSMRRPRPQEKNVDSSNLALLQEIAFLKNQKMIKRELKHRDEVYKMQREEAIKYNLLQECQCCFDGDLIPEECYFCLKGCVFCKECVRRGAENIIGNAGLRFPCFATCDSEFSLHTLQMVLPRNTFEKLAQNIAIEEAKRANIDGVEMCPFCDWIVVVPDDKKVIKCCNMDCMTESCRMCRHVSHIPLKCNEVEYDEDVRRRTYIENKMTEALTRTCHMCGKKFIKESGCNKMTCVCGARQCYLCGAAVQDYNHFGEGRCPLHTNDNQINLQRVVASAANAKQELGDVLIKFDPSRNIEEFFS
uniref:E3 ubiquitin-protein ligase n=1 Tax=Anoplophora glabripennis TaxID=217634 RepID=V5GJN0_ANOGL